MKYCWSFSDNVGLGAPMCVLGAIVCVGNFGLEAFRSESPILYITKFGFLVVMIAFALLLTAFVCMRRYEIYFDGITICYPLGIKKKYLWDEFSEIALCKIHYAAWGTDHIIAIRCIVGEEKGGPKEAVVGKERWTRIEYEVVHFKKIISIYKTEERLAEFHKLCPHPIKDYRHLEDHL